jgi:hypothetical protein
MFYPHNFHQSELDYELGIAAYENRLVWTNGPFKASRHDITIFRLAGLTVKIPPGHRAIADNDYRVRLFL